MKDKTTLTTIPQKRNIFLRNREWQHICRGKTRAGHHMAHSKADGGVI